MRGLITICLGAALLAGCTQPSEQATMGTNAPLTSAQQAGLSETATAGTRVWISPDLNQHLARNFLIPAVTVDRGRGSRFVGVDPDQVAATLTADVRRAVSARVPVTASPGPGTHTLQLSLVRAIAPHQVATASSPYPFLNASVGMPNVVTEPGELLITGKVLDTATGAMVAAFVTPVNPNDMLMSASPGPTGAEQFVRDASESFAHSLAASIVRARENAMATGRQ